MTPPEITGLEMDAAIAKQKATAAEARASIATLEHQRSLLGLPHSPSTTLPRAGVPWLVLMIIAAVAFALGLNTAEGPSLHRALSSFVR